LLLAGGPRETDADDDGRFVFEDVPRGLSKFVVRATGRGVLDRSHPDD
jgi:hypothetical protein